MIATAKEHEVGASVSELTRPIYAGKHPVAQ